MPDAAANRQISWPSAWRTAAGVGADRIYTDVGLSGANRPRPGLGQAMAACRAGDTLVVTSLDRLARSVPDARDLVADLAERGVILHLGGSVHDPSDPVGPVSAMVADFQTALVRGRTAEACGWPGPRGA